MPTIWEVRISGIEPSNVRMSGMHRFLSAWFSETDVEHASRKAYSVKSRLDGSAGVAFRIGCVEDGLAQALSTLQSGRAIQFGTTFPRVGIVESVTCVAESTWADLAADLGTAQWRLEFTSPCVVRTAGVAQPWPEPFALLRGLAVRWPAQEGAAEFDESAARAVAVTSATIRDVAYLDAPTPLRGAVGTAEWTWVPARSGLPSTDEGRHTIERLMRLAEFAGMGGYVQHGMGSVVVAGRAGKPAER
ncbi:MAG: CRISPR system precrRNA processing endoribonuclease RAMP protein Cas6 [Propionibacteriaceae bacterium]|nr:CRISPR system precrRNA processing endoribonuclease RAMP protein Cas6 [Micropruina sp.]HBX81082.1 hypothetical protein [Propionibacteriaceae bacterium]HBY22666.1 hypothetical protein [Propionibacteriaceae bacterium]